jgi:D-glycero-D-manno-heptose 1,7-bisphosphate phosphatase
VLNRRVVDGYVTDPAGLEILDLAMEAARQARQAGAAVIVVSNQGCIARGLATAEQILAVQEALVDRLGKRGVVLDGVYWCPHHPLAEEGGDPCTCRKPEPGMFLLAAADLGVDLARSVMVGDHPTDHQAAAAAGIPDGNRIAVSEATAADEVTELVMAALASA